MLLSTFLVEVLSRAYYFSDTFRNTLTIRRVLGDARGAIQLFDLGRNVGELFANEGF